MIAAGTRLGPYEVLAALGAGGMGEVYKGRDTRLDRSVAIKVLPPHLSSDPDFKLRFDREARVISGFTHPHICALHDVGEEAGLAYLVMEYCDGETLADRLEKGPLPLEQVLKYGIQIADALDRAHRSGIVHRDLKPGNIMLTKSGAKLLDFGLAKPAMVLGIADGATEHKPLTAEGMIIGTFQYMAPEQLNGSEADTRTDIFAFGAILYEMATGRRAFEGKSKASLIAAILDRQPQPILELQPLMPPALDRLIRTALEKDPDDRWQSAHDLKRELEWIRDGLSAPSVVSASAPRRIEKRARWIAALVVLPLAAAAATWLTMRATAPAPPRIVASLAPPPGTQFVVTGDTAGPVTISPDGQHATFVALGSEGPTLWVTSFATGVTKPIPSTDKAAFPFWSPDSRGIAFFADGKLQITDIDGARPRVIADAPDGRGGAWGPDGQIVYSSYTTTGLSRVSLSGSAPVPVTEVNPPYTTHRWPSFLPDGKHFVYLAASHSAPDNPNTAIFLASLDGKTNRKLVTSAGNGVVWRDYLLYLRSNKLVAQRLEDGMLQGEPVEVWNEVLYDPGTWRSIFSVSSGGTLVAHSGSFVRGAPLLWLDRTGKKLGELGPAVPYGDIALSPDGTRVALVIGDPKGILYVHDLAREVSTRFSFVDGSLFAPVWSRDGRSIVFATSASTGSDLYIKPADGSAPERKLLSSRDLIRPTDITPDGRSILFDKERGAAGDVMAIPLSGGKAIPVVSGEGQQYDGHLSPDGRWLLYIASTSGDRSVILTSYPPGGAQWQVSTEPSYLTWWNPSGREILYLTGYDVKAAEVSFAAGTVQIGAPRSLFRVNINTNVRGLTMTPDGSRFLGNVMRSQDSAPALLVTDFARELP